MLRIRYFDSVWIIKDFRSFAKSHSVLLNILKSLLVIPFEFHDDSS